MNGVHAEAALHRDETAERGVSALELLHDQAVFDIAQAGAAVAMEIGPEEAEVSDRTGQLVGKSAVAEVLRDLRNELVLDELTRCLANEQLFLAQQRIEIHEVNAFEFEHRGPERSIVARHSRPHARPLRCIGLRPTFKESTRKRSFAGTGSMNRSSL